MRGVPYSGNLCLELARSASYHLGLFYSVVVSSVEGPAADINAQLLNSRASGRHRRVDTADTCCS